MTEPDLVRAQLQNEVVVAIILKVLVHLADVGMVQRLVNPDFAHELALRSASRRNLLEILGLGQARLLHHLARVLLPRPNARQLIHNRKPTLLISILRQPREPCRSASQRDSGPRSWSWSRPVP